MNEAHPVNCAALTGSIQPSGSEEGRAQWPIARWAATSQRLALQVVTLPFDSARSLYSLAARSGLIERSMLANRDFERALTSMEQLTLGPWARRV